jgi:uncharacterized RDD family membrane protein YckC
MKMSPKEGVFYEIEDYAGVGRRLIIVLIDFCILFMGVLTLYVAAILSETRSQILVPSCFLLAFVYLAVLPSAGVGTIGYAATGVRLVDLYGRTASIWRSSFRFGFLVFGLVNLLADILWLELTGVTYRGHTLAVSCDVRVSSMSGHE